MGPKFKKFVIPWEEKDKKSPRKYLYFPQSEKFVNIFTLDLALLQPKRTEMINKTEKKKLPNPKK